MRKRKVFQTYDEYLSWRKASSSEHEKFECVDNTKVYVYLKPEKNEDTGKCQKV